MPQIVQFMHPGRERTDQKWVQTGPHARRFVRMPGHFLPSLDSSARSNDLYFWCEWEADASVIDGPLANEGDRSRFVFLPFYSSNNGKRGLNTDPFVFGDEFYYCICKQSYPSLRDLAPGSLLLFGSMRHKRFILDTVFVVKDREPYCTRDYKKLREMTNQVYFDVSIQPLFDPPTKSGCLAFKEQKYNGSRTVDCDDESDACHSTEWTNRDCEAQHYTALMYSHGKDIFTYVPCSPANGRNSFFSRPVIDHSRLSRYITDSLSQGLKITTATEEEVREVWFEVTRQIIKHELCLMIHCELPGKQANGA